MTDYQFDKLMKQVKAIRGSIGLLVFFQIIAAFVYLGDSGAL